MRKAFWIGGLTAAAALIAAAAAVLLVDVNRFRQPIQSQLEKGLHRSVALGQIGLRLLPLAITVNDLSIGESPSFATGRPFARARQLRVRVGLSALLRKQVQVESLVLDRPAIELVRDRAGKWNFASLGGESTNAGGTGGFELGRMQIEDGTLAVTDLANRNSRAVYDHIDIDLRDWGPGKVFQLTAAARLPGSSGNALRMDGKGGPAGSGPLPFTGRISLDKASVAGLMRFMNSGKAQVLDGALSGKADIDSAGGLLKANGTLELADLRIQGGQLGYPVRLEYRVSLDSASGMVKAPEVKASVGGVPISLSVELDTKASLMKGSAKVSRASLAEILALARALGAAEVSGSGVVSLEARIQGPYDRPEALSYAGSGTLEKATLQLSSLRKPLEVRSASLAFDKANATLENLVASLGGSTLRGRMAARNLAAPEVTFGFHIDKLDIAELQQSIGGGPTPAARGAAEPAPGRLSAKGSIDVDTLLVNGIALNRVHSDVTLAKSVLEMAPLTAEIFGGKETGTMTVDMRSQPARVALNTSLSEVDAQKLLAATTSMKQTLSGLLAAGLNATVSLTDAEMVRTLNGTLNLNLKNGRLAGVNILNQLAGVAKFLGYRENPQAYTDLVQLAGDLKVTNGVATTDNLRIQIEGGTLTGTGTMNLVTQALDLRITAMLDRGMSQKVGGTQIGGFLTTALANNSGELVIPALVTGTFAQPRFLPDAGRVAEMKLKNLIPASGSAGSGAEKGAPAAVRGAMGLIERLRGGQKEGAGKR